MSNKNNNFEHIPQEKFRYVQMDERLHDNKVETKARSFFQDAMLRFSKNKSSVVAAWILLFLILFSLISPMVSPYTMDDKDNIYKSYPSYVPAIAKLGLGIMDGGMVHGNQNEKSMLYWRGIAEETGLNPAIEIVGTHTNLVKQRGEMVEVKTYDLKVNRYFENGIVYRTLSYEDFQKLQDWQNETGIQVIYPYVDLADIENLQDYPNLWYKVNSKGNPILDADGNFIPVYSTRKEAEGMPYNSLRIKGDDGSYIYSIAKSGAVQCRVCYYNYYQYVNGVEPTYVLGTTATGQDLFAASGIGARFSLIFAVVVSVINLTIGAFYGAVQGYYGGYVDMILDRISDILSGVPFIVVTTLFQLHLAQKVGPVVSFVFAFILTGWIGMAALTRKQFYRFKSQEFVMAARTLGASDKRLMFKHIFPNSMGTIITGSILVIPSVIFSETSLSYLGIINLSSAQMTSIGAMLSEGQNCMTSAPHVVLFPALFIALLMISFNLFGNGLRDAFNPSTRGVD